jgi:hypothetical protein
MLSYAKLPVTIFMMNFLSFGFSFFLSFGLFYTSWIRIWIRIPNADLDSGNQSNADPYPKRFNIVTGRRFLLVVLIRVHNCDLPSTF